MYDDKNEIVVKAEVPGVDKENKCLVQTRAINYNNGFSYWMDTKIIRRLHKCL